MTEEQIRAWSIKAPYARWLVRGKKDIEIRDYKPPKTMCPGMKIGIQQSTTFHDVAESIGIKRENFPHMGCMLGTVVYFDFKQYHTLEEFVADANRHLNVPEQFKPGKSHGWIFRGAVEWDTPVPSKGQLGFYRRPKIKFPEFDKQS